MNNQAPPKPVHIGVGIDTARYAHHVSFLDEEKQTAAKPFHSALMRLVSMPRTSCSGCTNST